MMNVENDELLAGEDFSPVHAVKTGAHDAIATIIQYGTIAAILAVIGSVILPDKIRKRLRERWL